MRTAVEDPDDRSPDGVTSFHGRQYELDEVPAVLAETAGCHDCCCREAVLPANVTINIHGTVVSENGLTDLVLEAINNYRRRGPNPSREA